MMKATITQTRSISNPRRAKSGRSLIYISSPLDNLADDFAATHGVFGLPFKCKTWSRVCGQVTRIHSVELKKLFPQAHSIKFSAKAGCSCRCSPGYVMKHDPVEQLGMNYWVKIEASDLELAVVKKSINSLTNEASLREEVEAHKNAMV
jgi:hypothetical protein